MSLDSVICGKDRGMDSYRTRHWALDFIETIACSPLFLWVTSAPFWRREWELSDTVTRHVPHLSIEWALESQGPYLGRTLSTFLVHATRGAVCISDTTDKAQSADSPIYTYGPGSYLRVQVGDKAVTGTYKVSRRLAGIHWAVGPA